MSTSYTQCRILPGGASNTLRHLIQMHGHNENTAIFTLYSSDRYRTINDRKIPILCILPQWIISVFSWFQKHHVWLLSEIFDYRNLIVFYPKLTQLLSCKINRHQPDHLVISSFAVSKNIVRPHKKSNYRTTLYLHSPLQCVHTHRDEYRAKIKGMKGVLFRNIAGYLRRWDMLPRNYDCIIANSHYTAKCAQDIYNLTIDEVSYPPVREVFGQQFPIRNPDNYLVYVGRLVRFVKEVDKIIELSNITNTPLVLVGGGPDEAHLKSISGPNCLFVGWVDDEDNLIDIIRKSRGLINFCKESFGIATAEALLCGVPVLGYTEGGSTELVDQDSGILVEKKNPDLLVDALGEFIRTDRDRVSIQQRAKNTILSIDGKKD